MNSIDSVTSGVSDSLGETERANDRADENQRFLPVIIKRNDEARRHPDDTLQIAIHEGLEQLKRGLVSLGLSSMAAGMLLGFTTMAVGIAASIVHEVSDPLIQRLVIAAFYPLGFIICLMSGTELFTEHTATAVYPILDRRASLRLLPRLWLTVLAGNIIGAAICSYLLYLANDVVGAQRGYALIAHHLTSHAFGTILISAILAGWLMALGAWLILATPPTLSQLVCIYIVTFLIGIGGFHHSIAGSAELLTAIWLCPEFSLRDLPAFAVPAVLGNLIGGTIFVALLNYGHIRQTRVT